MRTLLLLSVGFISMACGSDLAGQTPIALPALSSPDIRSLTPEETREMARVHRYHGLGPTVAERFERVLNRLSIAHTLESVSENLDLNHEQALALSELLQKRKTEIDSQLNAVWQRLSGAEPTHDLVDNEFTVLITHEAIEENQFLAEIKNVLTPAQEAILLKELSRSIWFANFLYCVREYRLTPHQRSLFNDAGRAILPSARKTRDQMDNEFQQKFHVAMNSLSREQFEQVARAKGIFPTGKTLREFYLDQDPERQKKLADNVQWFAEIRVELEP
ncbi:MAG: hypothetical protein NXI32_27565 [bacterium]|nr:hypothetical protein [bacterium]